MAERFASARWLQPFIATGQLALTLHVAHVVLGMELIEALGRLENRSPQFAVRSAVVFTYSPSFLRIFGESVSLADHWDR